MSADNLDAVNLAAVPVNGQIHEDLMDKIFDVSPIDLPFTDAVAKGTSKNFLKEWVREELETANPDNARIDGSSSAGLNDTVVGERLATYHQIMSKTVRVSDRGREVDTVGTADELVRQLIKRGKAIRRDLEASLTSRNIAVAGDGTAAAGKLAGIGGWIGTGQAAANSVRGAGGADPILSGSPGGYPTTEAVAGTKGAGTEANVKAMIRAAYDRGGEVTCAMSIPSVIEKFSDFLFTSSARVATLQSDAPQSNRTNNASGGGKSGGGVVAQGSVNIYVSSYGTVELVPNRFQPEVAAGVGDLYLLDLTTWEVSFLQGYETNELARDGLAENREITCDVTLISENEEANSVVADIDGEVDFTA